MTRAPQRDGESTDDGGASRRAVLRSIGTTAGAVLVGGPGAGTAAAGDDAAIYRADLQPVVDGWYGEAWDVAERLPLDNVIIGSSAHGGSSDLDATAMLLWDADNLYFFVEVADDAMVQDSGAIHDDDSIDLFVDIGNEDESSYDGDEFMYQFRADGSGFQEVKNGATAGVEWGVRTDTADGYNVEGAIPWSTLGESPADGVALGLDVHVNDDDGGGSRDSKLAWHATDSNVWDDPSNMGTAHLRDRYPSVHETASAPTIDGAADAAWDDGETVSLDNVIIGSSSHGGTSDLDASATTLYDADDLYVLVEVTDDTAIQDSGAIHDDDSIDLFLDVGNEDETSYDGDEFMYQFRADGSGFQEVKNGATAGVSYAAAATSSGYNVEVAIPHFTVGTSPSDGKQLGFDVHVNDDDSGGSRDSKLAWYATDPNVWDDPSNMGTVAYSADSSGGSPDGPPSAGDWTLTFEDQFDQGTLDTDHWEIGFGWGMTSTNDDADVDPDRVWVDGDRDILVLEVYHDDSTGEVTQGAINSKDAGGSHNPSVGVTRGPGTYFEARAKPIDREGVLPAFWSKPNNENWPPEIDFYEIFHNGDANDPEVAHFNTHYTTSGYCDDSGSHRASGSYDHDTNENLSQNWNVYGCAWKGDQVEFYFNDVHVATESSSEVMASLNNDNCNPFYLTFTNHVNRVGTPDYSYSWREQHHVDWVRVWDLN